MDTLLLASTSAYINHSLLPISFLLWQEISSLLHERTNAEPEAVEEGKFIVQFVRRLVARMRVGPLVGREPVGARQAGRADLWG